MSVGSTFQIHVKGVRDVMVARSTEMPNLYRNITGDPITTTAVQEKMVLMTGLATATKVGDGSNVSFDEITAPYNKNFATEIYAIGVELTEKQLQTDQSGRLRKVGQEFARSHGYAREVMVANILNNGTDAAGYPTILGVALASASQPTTSGATWSNLSTAAALDILALEQMLTDRKGHKTLKNQRWLGMGPVKLIVPVELEITASRLLESLLQPGTADNDKNVARSQITLTPGNPFITDTNSYWMIPENDNPFFLLSNSGMSDATVKMDYDIRTLKHLMVAARDETVGVLYPAGVQLNQGA
jgi:hypothetical protein